MEQCQTNALRAKKQSMGHLSTGYSHSPDSTSLNSALLQALIYIPHIKAATINFIEEYTIPYKFYSFLKAIKPVYSVIKYKTRATGNIRHLNIETHLSKK